MCDSLCENQEDIRVAEKINTTITSDFVLTHEQVQNQVTKDEVKKNG